MDVTDLKAADAAGFLSFCSASTAFFEFLLNPIAGKLSDGWGRKVFLLQAPVVSTIMRSLVCMYPSKVTIAAERVLTGATMTIGGSTTCASSLADTIDDTVELGRAYASMGTSAGLGVMIGPVIGALVVGSTKNARRAYAAAALLSALQIGVSSSFIRESLRPEQRKTVNATDLATAVNPLGVLSLFQYGPVVATLVSVASIQCFCEGKSISDLNTYYTMNDAKFSYSVRSLYTTVFGVVMTLSGIFGRQTIKTLGTRGHTTFQNIMSAIGFVATGCCEPKMCGWIILLVASLSWLLVRKSSQLVLFSFFSLGCAAHNPQFLTSWHDKNEWDPLNEQRKISNSAPAAPVISLLKDARIRPSLCGTVAVQVFFLIGRRLG